MLVAFAGIYNCQNHTSEKTFKKSNEKIKMNADLTSRLTQKKPLLQ